MRVLLVVNPRATRVTPRRTTRVVERLAERHEVTVVRTERRDHATELARAGHEYDAVVVLAGDGTLNEVIGALADTDTVVGCLPGGSTNVFARTIGLPDNLGRATDAVSEALESGRTRRIGLGSVNGRRFLLHLGVGWDAELVSIVERHAGWKRWLGHGLFVYSGLRAFFGTYDRTRPHFSVHLPDRTVDDGYFTVVLNSDPYTFVGHRPFVVSPTTTLDSALAAVTTRSMSVRDFIPLPLQALSGRGGVRPGPTVEVDDDVDALTICRLEGTPAASMSHQVDGDFLGGADELVVRHHPDSLTILDPSGPRR